MLSKLGTGERYVEHLKWVRENPPSGAERMAIGRVLESLSPEDGSLHSEDRVRASLRLSDDWNKLDDEHYVHPAHGIVLRDAVAMLIALEIKAGEKLSA